MTSSSNSSTAGSPKEDRLKSRKRIEWLFTHGKSVKQYPLLLSYVPRKSDGEVAISAGFSVSKKRFRRAVDRNRVKRIMREVYRQHKSEFLEIAEQSGVSYDFMFVYLARELPVYSILDQKISGLVSRWKNAIHAHPEQRSAEHEKQDSKD